MRKVTKAMALCLAAAATLTLTACGAYTNEEAADVAKAKGFTVITTRQASQYGIDPGIPVDIGSAKCAADFVASVQGQDYVVIYGPDGRKLTGMTGHAEMFYNPTPDSLRKLSKTAVCYRD